jgi:hypothetical protein
VIAWRRVEKFAYCHTYERAHPSIVIVRVSETHRAILKVAAEYQ